MLYFFTYVVNVSQRPTVFTSCDLFSGKGLQQEKHWVLKLGNCQMLVIQFQTFKANSLCVCDLESVYLLY